ncbi:hypothetical protein ADUPG1_004325, partial [Aduncisulcus paluster]
IPTGRRANRLENALVKADQPLEFTVFGGQKFVVTHYIVLKTLLEADVPLLIGLDGMNAMKVKLDLVDIRGYRGHADQTSEIGDLLKRL